MQAWLTNHGAPLLAGIGVLLVVTVGGVLLNRPSSPPIEVRAREPLPTPTVMVYVHVDGAVAAPGVYALPAGGRIFEAIEVAGGTLEEADTRELNLAARIADGQKLVIPYRAEALPSADQAPQAAASSPPAATAARININTASQRVLETLPGIGPVTAGRVVEHRQANGPFTRIEQLREARLVNAPTFERIRNLISVDGP